MFIDQSEQHYTGQTSKFNNFLNQTMLNSAFKGSRSHFDICKWDLLLLRLKTLQVLIVVRSQVRSYLQKKFHKSAEHLQKSATTFKQSMTLIIFLFVIGNCQEGSEESSASARFGIQGKEAVRATYTQRQRPSCQ